MKTKKEPFLSSYISDFKIGDLIYWVEMDWDEGFNIIHIERDGAIVDFVKKPVGESREVLYAKILPFGESRTVILALHLLKKRN